MKRIFSIVFTISLVFAVSAIAMAQTRTPHINQRERNQQRRINQGVKSGELTRGETRHLEAEEGRIKADEKIDKADGKVTPAERRQLEREENRASRNIYRDKHNGRTRN
ncbi:MAG TPA: hypothetical protein VFC63_00180 [Blastocatellia bacterium]|nr:hypothetical protein [Blastocatellia bacterium]